MTEEELIQENAKLAVERLAPISGLGERFGYNLESVEWLEGYVERLRKDPKCGPDPAPPLISVLGSYPGQCIIEIYGGEWRLNEELGWDILLKEGNMAFPFNKLRKLFENGVEGGDSVHSFVSVIGDFQKEGWPSDKKK